MRTPLRGLGPPGDYTEVLEHDENDQLRDVGRRVRVGSLSAADRREFEAHMATCAGCREAVGELSGVPALLSRLDREDVAAIDESGADSRARIPKGAAQDVAGVAAVVAGNGALAPPPYPRGDLGGLGGRGRSAGCRCVRRCREPILTGRAAGDRVGGAHVTSRDEPADLDGVGVPPALGDVHQPEMRLPGSADCAP